MVVDSMPGLEWLAVENSKAMFHKRKVDKGKRPIDSQNADMMQRGFLPASSVVNTKDFGVPQSRGRAWSLYIKSNKVKDWVDTEEVINMFHSFKCKPMPLRSCLLKTSMGRSTQDEGKCVANDDNAKWRDEFLIVRDKLGKARMLINS